MGIKEGSQLAGTVQHGPRCCWWGVPQPTCQLGSLCSGEIKIERLIIFETCNFFKCYLYLYIYHSCILPKEMVEKLSAVAISLQPKISPSLPLSVTAVAT